MKSLNKHLGLVAIICAIGMLIGSSISYADVNSLKSEDWQGMVDDFTRRIEMKPNDATLYYDRAIAYAALGKLKRAIEDGTKAIQLNPEYANAHINRGIDYIALGDHNRAVADFNKAIELDPKDASAYYARGFVYHKLGRVKEAEEDFAKSAQLGYKGAHDLIKSKENAVEEKAGLKAPAPNEVGRRPDTGPTPSSPSTPPPQIETGKKEAVGGLSATGTGIIIFSLVVCFAIYAVFAFSLQVIAKKTDTPMGWFAWIPILNFVLMCKIARKPIWWLVLMLIPLINIIIILVLWMKIAESLGRPGWIGLLMLVPVVNLLIPPYLAFSK